MFCNHNRKARDPAVATIVALIIIGSAVATQAAEPLWPSKPISAVVPIGAGSAADIISRIVFEQVSIGLGQPIIVENRSGAGVTIGAAMVARSNPDGYTILASSSTLLVAPFAYPGLSFDIERDFAGITPIAKLPSALVVARAGDIKSVADLIVAAARKSPDQMNYASPGAIVRLNTERFLQSGGMKALAIPFKSAPEALNEVVASRIDFYFCPILSALPLIRDGKLRALAVSGAQRAADLPDVPTLGELGYADADDNFWIGLFAPQ